MSHNFSMIMQNADFLAFKDVFLKTQGASMPAVRVEELFLSNFEKMSENFQANLEQTIKGLQ